MITEEHTIIKAPVMVPYSDHILCPACGLTGGFLRYWRRFTKGAANCHVVFAYCPGNKAPTENISDPNPLAMAFGKGDRQIEVEYPCAGIDKPHIHIKCGRCDCGWLMEVKWLRDEK